MWVVPPYGEEELAELIGWVMFAAPVSRADLDSQISVLQSGNLNLASLREALAATKECMNDQGLDVRWEDADGLGGWGAPESDYESALRCSGVNSLLLVTAWREHKQQKE